MSINKWAKSLLCMEGGKTQEHQVILPCSLNSFSPFFLWMSLLLLFSTIMWMFCEIVVVLIVIFRLSPHPTPFNTKSLIRKTFSSVHFYYFSLPRWNDHDGVTTTLIKVHFSWWIWVYSQSIKALKAVLWQKRNKIMKIKK